MSTERHGEDATPGEEVRGWFAGRLPDGWFTEPPEVLVDREEITVVGPLGGLDAATDASSAARADAGVARSRSDALAWCVRLVGEHEVSWLGQLREALRRVEEVRVGGPQT